MATLTFNESVQQRAFELFLERGGVHGNDQEDWFKAEMELRNINSGKKSSLKSSEKPVKKR